VKAKQVAYKLCVVYSLQIFQVIFRTCSSVKKLIVFSFCMSEQNHFDSIRNKHETIDVQCCKPR